MIPCPQAPGLVAAWLALPPEVQASLLHQSALAESRLQAGLALLDCASPPFALAADLLLAAWECSPATSGLLQHLLALHRQCPFLSSAQERAFAALLDLGLPDSGLPAPDLPAPDLPATDPRLPVQLWCKALAYFDRGDYATALQYCEKSASPAPGKQHGPVWYGITELQGHCLLRLGQRSAAFALWRQVLAARPWQVHLALSLHDGLQGYDQALSPAPGDLNSPIGGSVVLLYSWNKAPWLHTTLQALEASLPDIQQLICLDNGSSDNTAACLRGWQERWGSRLKVIRLPVNVGAAAARNWLAALPEVQKAPFAAYVDDDVCLPADWLRHLARAVQVQPQAQVWGCRIQDMPPNASPNVPQTVSPNVPQAAFPVIQSGPLHLTLGFAPAAGLPPLPGQDYGPEAESADMAFSPLRAHAEPFSVTTLPPNCPDRGQWNYLRPCASVTGCCHLFRSDNLQKKPFALSLSPSQYDDLEHDLRALREGRLACYTGFCAGLHAKKSGQAAAGLSPAAFGSALGNKYKLHGMFDAESIYAMAQHECAVLQEDLLKKLAFIDTND